MSKLPFFLISSGRFMGDLSMQRAQSELYSLCLEKSGAQGALFSSGNARFLAAHFDGLVLSGGGDLHPSLFGQACESDKLSIDCARDSEEIALFEAFYALKKPILGICRGLQVMNVALGGTLFQHIENHANVCHAVSCTSFLSSLISAQTFVNSYHHQAIDRVASELQAVARSPDGIVEALSHDTLPILGVQWHAERMVPSVCEDIAHTNHLPIFQWLSNHA